MSCKSARTVVSRDLAADVSDFVLRIAYAIDVAGSSFDRAALRDRANSSCRSVPAGVDSDPALEWRPPECVFDSGEGCFGASLAGECSSTADSLGLVTGVCDGVFGARLSSTKPRPFRLHIGCSASWLAPSQQRRRQVG